MVSLMRERKIRTTTGAKHVRQVPETDEERRQLAREHIASGGIDDRASRTGEWVDE